MVVFTLKIIEATTQLIQRIFLYTKSQQNLIIVYKFKREAKFFSLVRAFGLSLRTLMMKALLQNSALIEQNYAQNISKSLIFVQLELKIGTR